MKWTVIVPVKPSAVGKSRLSVEGVDREALARAMALDTIFSSSLAANVARVIVVTDDAEIAESATRYRKVDAMPDGGAGGLNGAVARGAEAAGEDHRAALLADLPGLRHRDLSRALQAAAAVDHAVIADAAGTGSTIVTASVGAPWRSFFGDASLARHVADGFVPLEVPDAPSVRFDVDTAQDLNALRGHVGPLTTLALRAARHEPSPAPPTYWRRRISIPDESGRVHRVVDTYYKLDRGQDFRLTDGTWMPIRQYKHGPSWWRLTGEVGVDVIAQTALPPGTPL